MTDDAIPVRRRPFGLYFYFGMVALVGLILLGVYAATAIEMQGLKEQIRQHPHPMTIRGHYVDGFHEYTAEQVRLMDVYSSLQGQLRQLERRNESVGGIASIWAVFVLAPLVFVPVSMVSKSLASRAKSKSVPRIDMKRLQDIGQVLMTKGREALRPAVVGSRNLSRADELRKWAQLLEDGLITEEEFARARREILGK